MNLAGLSKVPQRKNVFFFPSGGSNWKGSKYCSIFLINRARKSHCSSSSTTLITAFGIYCSIFASHYESQTTSCASEAIEDGAAKTFYRGDTLVHDKLGGKC